MTSISPFAPVTRRYSAGHLVPAHAHAWPQLLYASSGVMRVETGTGSWIVPPQRAVWLPPNSLHETTMLTDVHLASLYLSKTKKWSLGCEVVEISKLLRELIVAASQIRPGRKLSPRDNLITESIVKSFKRRHADFRRYHCPPTSACSRSARTSLRIERRHFADEAFGRGRKHVENNFASVPARARHQLSRLAPARAGRYAQAHLIQGVPVKVVAVPAGIYGRARISVRAEAQ